MLRAATVLLALAAAGAAEAAPAEPLSSARILEVFAGLAVVVALVFGLAILLRRVNMIRPAGAGRLRILESVPLGTREKLVLVEVDGQALLLGLAPGRIQALHVAGGAAGTGDYAAAQQQAVAALYRAGEKP